MTKQIIGLIAGVFCILLNLYSAIYLMSSDDIISIIISVVTIGVSVYAIVAIICQITTKEES